MRLACVRDWTTFGVGVIFNIASIAERAWHQALKGCVGCIIVLLCCPQMRANYFPICQMAIGSGME